MNKKEKINIETPEETQAISTKEKETATLVILTSMVVVLLIIAFLASKRLFKSEPYDYDQNYQESETVESEEPMEEPRTPEEIPTPVETPKGGRNGLSRKC